ncbi:iron-containing alcohol dehydrogenase [Motiliproteus coralliicola]|uniref:Iron-containing alcohol dehydrogenase n=1 Tax=Motiliproteus coralliicola TaxID=2283196 RepID=A0A369WTL9_9GAMM|nr:iron-containing alcohol dehydrogenase [Motiliproteus coralliicola]RDE24399.1 iron-containing alcohol dehydrogenase [Motiliproteus coralliicola]
MSTTGYFNFNMRTVVHCAPGAIIRLPALFEGLGAKRVVLLSDAGLKQAGIVDQVARVFEANSGGSVSLVGVFAEVAPDAACNTVNDALRYCRENAADAILALGGGSVLDAAKGVKYALHHNLTDIKEAIQAGIKLETWPKAQPMGIPHIAVPTTAGTGAEVTTGAVLYNEEAGIKGNLVVPFIEADIAVLDAQLTVGLPPHITAQTGMDAMTHALESLAIPHANHFTDAHALLAAQVIEKNLVKAVENGADIDARSSLLQSSTMACNAMVNAMGPMPVHNCSHAFGALYHIPHGEANGVLLPIVIDELRDFYRPNAARLAVGLNLHAVADADADAQLDAVVERLNQMLDETGQSRTFSRFAIDPSEIERIVMAIATDPVAAFMPINPQKIAAITARAIGV